MPVQSIPIPKGSLISSSLVRIDYADTFEIEVPAPVKLEELPKLFFKAFPKWFGYLMGFRELLAKWIGLKTATGMDVESQMQSFSGQPGESIALFHVLGRTETEILSGEEDSHLDFRLSFFVYPEEGGNQKIILSTVVQKHNWIGRLYFFFVKPFHRLIVPVILRRIKKLIISNRT